MIRVNLVLPANECRGEPQVIVLVSRCNWCMSKSKLEVGFWHQADIPQVLANVSF